LLRGFPLDQAAQRRLRAEIAARSAQPEDEDMAHEPEPSQVLTL
jgi:hypothetical protein